METGHTMDGGIGVSAAGMAGYAKPAIGICPCEDKMFSPWSAGSSVIILTLSG